MSEKKYFLTPCIPLLISEINSSTEERDFLVTSNEIFFKAVETIGVVGKVNPSENGVSVILHGMKDQSIMLYAGGEYASEEIKRTLLSLTSLSAILVRGKAWVSEKEGEITHMVGPRQVIIIPDEGDESRLRELWTFWLLHSRIDEGYPLLESAGIMAMVENLGLLHSEIGPGLVKIDSIIGKVAPVSMQTITPSNLRSERKGHPAPKPAITRAEKKSAKSKSLLAVKTAETRMNVPEVKDTILSFLKEGPKGISSIHLHLLTKGVNEERKCEEALISLHKEKRIVLDGETVSLPS
jgi:hypothetical protein